MDRKDNNTIAGVDLNRLQIHIIPDPVLHRSCAEIDVFDKRLRTFAKKMTASMKRSGGIGLAGPQVGVLQRIIVVGAYDRDLVLINPRIVPASIDADIKTEGCLSIPGETFDVTRFFRIEVWAHDITGKKVHFSADSLGARVIQHETDHLEGVLICDKGVKEAGGKEYSIGNGVSTGDNHLTCDPPGQQRTDS
jgi:peptide deformylase